LKLKNHNPTETKVLDNTTIRSKGKLSENELETLAKSILQTTLEKYIKTNQHMWKDKISKLENELAENTEYNPKTIKAVGFLMKLFKEKPPFAWCLYSLDSKANQNYFLPTLNDVQGILSKNERISNTDTKGSLPRILKDKVEQWLKSDLTVAANLASVFRISD
jgi:hypothetical protein